MAETARLLTGRDYAGAALALGLAALYGWQLRRAAMRKRAAAAAFHAEARGLLADAQESSGGGAGLPRLSGRYRGVEVDINPVTDTLATRRLPALWLLVTVKTPLPLRAKFDLMMRPAGPTTFSNFDQLAHSLGRPDGFPEEGLVKSDDAAHALPAHIVRPHLGLFASRRAKELLIAPNGLRVVWLLAEADRARYGVFRQAEFGGLVLDPALVRDLLDRLLALRDDVLAWREGRP